uniref:R3H domain containing 2 n=1 Tax=Cyanistes caeruleus TaxID=156563 RepID=A0A8C0VKM2_CYACU
RSLAVCEESSGTPSSFVSPQDIIQLHVSCPSDKEEEKSTKDGVEKEEKDKNKEKTPRKMLSRDSSQEYTDSTGIDLHEFLVNTLKKNPRDRMMLLKLEQEILEFISDNNNQFKKFPQMTSYHRMLLHRVAAYFGMDHNVDQTGKAVIINKTSNTRIPEQRFSEHIKDEKNAEFPQRFILKRDDTSMDRDDNQIRLPLQDGRRSKSIEEREEEYQRVRERIFARESGQNGYLTDSRAQFDSSALGRGNRDGLSRASGSRQSSTESEIKSLEPRPWSSTDSDGSIRNLRPPVTKASSFSGISILTRGDSVGSSKGTFGSLSSHVPLSRSGSVAHVWGPFWGSFSQSREKGSAFTSRAVSYLLLSHVPSSSILPLIPLQADELSSPFGQISLSRQGSTEAPDPSSAMFQSSLISQHPQQTGFIMATPGQPIPTSSYSASGHTAPTQQVLQPQGYIQPPQQVRTRGDVPRLESVYFAGVSLGQFPLLCYLLPAAFLPAQVPMASESQNVVQQPFQQPVLVPASQSVQGGLQAGGVPIYYSVIPTAQQNGTSPSVGFLQPPGSEQYQMPQSPAPCSPPQMQQQYSGVSPSGPGVVVMQLNVPNGPQAPQNPPVVQWSHCKYYSLEQRGQKPGDLYNPDTSAQASTQLNSPITSPTQSPTPSPVTNLNSVCTGLSPLPVLTQFPRPMGPAQGDGRYSLLGQPLQYNLSLCPPPLLHNQPSYTGHQGQTGMKHGNRSKRQALKSASTDLGTSDVVLGRVLEVTDLPEGITRTEADKLFTQLAMAGAKIQWLKETQGRRGDGGGGDNSGTPENGRHSDLAALYTIVAVFPSPLAAQNASLRLNNSLSRFKLRVAKKNYDLRVLERASSQ